MREAPAAGSRRSAQNAADPTKLLTFRRDEVVFAQGEPATAVFYVVNGTLKVTTLSRQGREAILAVVSSGEFVGESCLLEPRRRTSVVAMNDCVLSCLEKSTVVGLLRSDPTFAELFTSHIVARSMRMEDHLLDHLLSSSEQRLARLLIRLADFKRHGRPEVSLAKLSQEDLAEMVGTTRPRINYFMNKFRRLGLVDYGHTGQLRIRRALQSVLRDD
jgi:CRP-like cAMP-binding protein